MNEARIAIIGAGAAGVATAYFLTQRGLRNVTLIDQEPVAGVHSSGRNAAILRTLIPDAVLRGMALRSAEFYRNPPPGFTRQALIDPVGLFLAAREPYAGTLREWAESDPAPLPLSGPEELYRRVPLLAPGIVSVVEIADEGVLDVHAIVQSFLQGAARSGAKTLFGAKVQRIVTRESRVTALETSQGPIEADAVVIAAGAWAAELANTAGCPLPLTPYRRHLLVTRPLPGVERHWPVVWIMGDEFYFRPESHGLLMCACDTVAVKPSEGEQTDPAQIERIADKAARWLPALGDAGIAQAWAGVRTFAPDDRFVIGPDPRLDGLFWVAGLAGHGVTCAPAIGRLAADWIAGAGSSDPAAEASAPARLAGQG
jgi:glycine/D-amino acid oxidase-like deaminating enzyme